MERRSYLKTVGGIGIAGAIGLGVTSQTAAAATVSISATGPAVVSNDRGQLSQLSIDPQFRVEWENLDDAVAKVFYLIEASVDGGDYWPIFRATPWLPSTAENNSYVDVTGPGTTGHYEVKAPHSVVLNQDSRFGDGDGPDESASPLVVADGVGRPDYASVDWTSYSPSDETRYLNGVSMGSASDAETFFEGEGETLQNNYPDIDAGYYGAASDTAPFESTTDGELAQTPVSIRYTFELQRPNLSYMKHRFNNGNSFSGTDAEKVAEAASLTDAIQESDIDVGNSEVVLNGDDGNQNFQNPTGIPYATLQATASNHVGILTTTAGFQASIKNEAQDSGVTGQTNPSAE